MLRAFIGVCIVAAAFGSSSSLSAGENWPQFRGPGADGMSDATGLPAAFSETENVRWKTPIHGRGWSSPVVWGEQIWLTTAPENGAQNYAVCIDLKTGQIERDIKLWDVAEPQFVHSKNSYASPTPAIEAGRVYVHFGAHGTAAIDTVTGKVLWERRDLPCDHFRGPASSPVIVDDLLVLTFDGYDFQYLVALDKHTGRPVWKRDRNIDSYDVREDGDYKKAYSTPKLATLAGRRQLISPSAGATIAYDPTTGAELWRVRSGGMNVTSPPLVADGFLICTTGYGGWRLFAVKPDGTGDVSDSHVAWKVNKAVPTRPSPILVDGLLYMASDDGIVSCLEPTSGKPVWLKRIGGNFSASPVYADGKIYFFDEEGTSTVIEPGRTFKALATNHLDEGCMASPAVVGRSLIVRTITDLYRIEETP